MGIAMALGGLKSSIGTNAIANADHGYRARTSIVANVAVEQVEANGGVDHWNDRSPNIETYPAPSGIQ
jgi:hypothetical protein